MNYARTKYTLVVIYDDDNWEAFWRIDEEIDDWEQHSKYDNIKAIYCRLNF